MSSASYSEYSGGPGFKSRQGSVIFFIKNSNVNSHFFLYLTTFNLDFDYFCLLRLQHMLCVCLHFFQLNSNKGERWS